MGFHVTHSGVRYTLGETFAEALFPPPRTIDRRSKPQYPSHRSRRQADLPVTRMPKCPPDRAPGPGRRSHCHGRWDRLDPERLARAVDRLLGGRPDLRARSVPGETTDPGPFTHLDLPTVGAAERRRAAETVCWILGRCLESDRATSRLLVAYLDPGGQESGHLLVAGRGPAVADAETCAALSETLLELYRDLERP